MSEQTISFQHKNLNPKIHIEMSDVLNETNSIESSEPEAKLCSLCNDETDDLYYCETCDRQQHHSDEENSEPDTNDLLCDGCIISHIKRNHSVKNEKGQDPLVCDKHKRPILEYCKTCDVPFCSKCLISHSSHQFQDLETRASDVKKEVFQLLGEMETCEKPLRRKKDYVHDLIKTHTTDQATLRETVLQEIDKLKELCIKTMDENEKQLEDERQHIIHLIGLVVNHQQRLRNLLSCTSAQLVRDFSSVQARVIKTKKPITGLINDAPGIKSCKAEEVQTCFREFGASIVQNITTKKVYETATHYICSDDDYHLFKISVGEGLLKAEKVRKNSLAQVILTERATQIEFKLPIDKIYT